MKNSSASLIAGIFLTVLSMSSFAELTIKHAQGEQHFIKGPEKVITLDLASLDTLDALNIDVMGVPKANTFAHLAKYKEDKYIDAGSLFEPNYETIAAQEPDLIIVATRSASAFKDLQPLAPTIDLTVWGENYLQQVRDVSQKIAKVFSKEKQLLALTQALNNDVDEVKTLAKKAGNALFLLTNGGKITAYGRGSRFGWIHDDLGIVPAIEDIKEATHGDPVSFEFVLETDPDWIFVLDRDAAIGRAQGAAQALLDNALINQTKAAKNKQIVYLNAANWYILAGGINATHTSVKEVLTALTQ